MLHSGVLVDAKPLAVALKIEAGADAIAEPAVDEPAIRAWREAGKPDMNRRADKSASSTFARRVSISIAFHDS